MQRIELMSTWTMREYRISYPDRPRVLVTVNDDGGLGPTMHCSFHHITNHPNDPGCEHVRYIRQHLDPSKNAQGGS